MDALKRSLASERENHSCREDQGQEVAQGRRGPARDAAADQRQAGQGRAEKGGEASALVRPIKKGRIVQQPWGRRADILGQAVVTSRTAQDPA